MRLRESKEHESAIWDSPRIGVVVRAKGDHHGAYKVCLTELQRHPICKPYEDERWGYKTYADAVAAGQKLADALSEVFEGESGA